MHTRGAAAVKRESVRIMRAMVYGVGTVQKERREQRARGLRGAGTAARRLIEHLPAVRLGSTLRERAVAVSGHRVRSIGRDRGAERVLWVRMSSARRRASAGLGELIGG